jgi:GNAT superfamily N-acetyltransferase
LNRIILLNQNQIPEALSITKSCAIVMKSEGIAQWDENYPNREILNEDVKNNQLYGYFEDDKLLAIIVLTHIIDEEYKAIKWLTENKNNLYIHRLAVDPNYQNRGIASQLMDFAENFAKENNHTSVRLDTFSQNPKNNYFYKKRGYTQLEDIYLPKQSEHPFHCFELIVNE